MEEDLAGEVLADKEPEFAAPVHHLSLVQPLLWPRVQLIYLSIRRRTGRDYLGSRLEAALLLDWGRSHFVLIITGGQRSLPVSFTRHRTATPCLGTVEKFINLTFPCGASLRPGGWLIARRRHARYEDLGVDVLVSWLLGHGAGLGNDSGELDMDEVTVRPGEGHHHCLPGPRSRQ